MDGGNIFRRLREPNGVTVVIRSTGSSRLDARSFARDTQPVPLLDPDDDLSARALHRHIDGERAVAADRHALSDDLIVELDAERLR